MQTPSSGPRRTSTTYFDVVRSMVPSHGDYRLIAGEQNVPSQAFTPLGTWGATGPSNALMHTLEEGDGALVYTAGSALYRRHFVTTNPIGGLLGNSGGGAPDFRSDNPAAVTAVQASGDFDNPMSTLADGAYINKPDEGTTLAGTGINYPYFYNAGYIDSTTFFSPNRVMPGPGMFGSLPTHIKRYLNDPTNPQLYAWRTLLFRRQPTHPDFAAINSTGLPSGTTPIAPDHLLMDFFWMPTVEPYAISQPFSSAGKINMNYGIMPFTYITRKTGMYAALANEKIAAVPNTAATAKSYKLQQSHGRDVVSPEHRYRADADAIRHANSQFRHGRDRDRAPFRLADRAMRSLARAHRPDGGRPDDDNFLDQQRTHRRQHARAALHDDHSPAHDEIEHLHHSLPRAGAETYPPELRRRRGTRPRASCWPNRAARRRSSGFSIRLTRRSPIMPPRRPPRRRSAPFIIGACWPIAFSRRSVTPSRR